MAEQAQYGRITIQIQVRDGGGHDLRFIDSHTGRVLAEEITPELNLDRAKEIAMGRAQELLSKISN
jgi:hypothetical protein